MSIVILLEQLANSTHYLKKDNLGIVIQSALETNDTDLVLQQFGDVGFLAHAEEVVSF